MCDLMSETRKERRTNHVCQTMGCNVVFRGCQHEPHRCSKWTKWLTDRRCHPLDHNYSGLEGLEQT